MDLVPCNEEARQSLVDSLFEVNEAGVVNKKMADYVARTFPSILIDIARLLTEQAIRTARELKDPAVIVKSQLKPYFMFNLLLGKCPQLTGLMYNYFENSSFQPLPEGLFQYNVEEKRIDYSYTGFTDELVKEILLSYFKYLTFSPKWFSAVWNWTELGRFITLHINDEIRYLAACCLSVITRPTRPQHIASLREIIGLDKYQTLIDLQIKYRQIYDNTFKPCIETKQQMAEQYAKLVGYSDSGYSYCPVSIAKVANVLLLKRDISLERGTSDLVTAQINSYVPVATLHDTISRIAYSISINKPCLIRGPCGSGKTSILDYIAAHTNRLNPPDYVKVQIGDQIDSKLLVGSYVCTEIPGQFDWRPGPLTKAMAYGAWIVFEDIDSAPSDLAQVIHSVIENGNLSCVSSCPIKLDSPHPDFRIFFTQRTSKSTLTENLKLGFGFVERLCDIVDLPDLKDNDLSEVITKTYNFEQQLVQILLRLYRGAESVVVNSLSHQKTRKVCLRDLFKLCNRLASRNLQPSEGKFSSFELEALFLDTIDCFLSSLPRQSISEPAIELGRILNLPSQKVHDLIFDRRPDPREESNCFTVGRARLDTKGAFKQRSPLAYTRQTTQLLESVSLCIRHREPVLLVGETGVGKTSIVQHIANLTATKLVVINLSQQSDSSDLLGGYKPVEIREIFRPLHGTFEDLFKRTFDAECNQNFLHHVNDCFISSRKNHQWATYLKLVCKLCSKALDKPLSKEILHGWNDLHDRARRLSKRLTSGQDTSSMALAFSEGSLLRAVRGGHWILLDEINLAEPDVLQCLIQILDSINKSHIYLHNSNENEQVLPIHPNFRVFACMNPSTDIGKRDLTIGTRVRFSEYFVEDVLGKQDLRLIVESYSKTCLASKQIASIVDFYLETRARSQFLCDIGGNSPIYSLRTLCRALVICSQNVCHNMSKSLYESLKITFLQQLNEASIIQVLKLMEQFVFDKNDMSSLLEAPIPVPRDDHQYELVEGFWIQKSNHETELNNKYILTKSVNKNLQSLSRIISLSQRRLPILIQGNTSVGKTSLIMYLAQVTANKCYRINNHEHTDLQEYVGRYVLKENGELVFQEGLLVRAMKKGYWIILDELNLAPSELLEALNRVLDDNRELFVPETGEIIKAHSKFALFATQNPPEEYAGRKLLSRAFRNRFIELHFDEIPGDELEIILHRRCEMAPQHARKIVSVMRELQMFRRESGCFNGKNSFMTLRDLFRWGERYAAYKQQIPDNEFFDWDSYLASEGLVLLEGRVRTTNEAETVKSIIEKVFNRELDRDAIYNRVIYKPLTFPAQFQHIHFSSEFKRMYVQLCSALKYKEPVLLCGQTGCGKTTACQLYAALQKQELITYNCHLNTESADFVGGVRPSRVESSEENSTKQTFPWVNGPLVDAMRTGGVFLLDEISLADEAVIERINSVLEPSRSITLTEKDGEEIYANESFRLVATMNPGGDFGKKELSPALRNRFTEIYCHNTTDLNQIRKIIEACLSRPLLKPRVAPLLLSVMHSFLKKFYQDNDLISVRDVISWTKFLNKTTHVAQPRPLSIQEALINGASLVFLDQFGTCGYQNTFSHLDSGRKQELETLIKKLTRDKIGLYPFHPETLPDCLEICHDIVKFKNFFLKKGPLPILEDVRRDFIIDASTVKKNLIRIVRAMQLDRPILLEGDPGSGKTSIVSALAKLTGHELVRINLSEQSDISDLFGSDLPDSTNSEDDDPKFCWHDGPLLRAIKNSHWILLDEMNLASQSVLEGLNACLDHRGEIYIAELNKRMTINRSSTRIFACQNPYSQGAARKGLPQSFLNRFTSIYIEPHLPKDLLTIITKMYPLLPHGLVAKMIEFNGEVSAITKAVNSSYEFNLRDVLYWCELLTKYVRGSAFKELELYKPDRFVQFVYLDRLRTDYERSEISVSFEAIFGCPIYEPPYRDIRLGEYSLIIARSVLARKTRPAPHLAELCILKYQLPYMESIAKAIEHNKMPILVGESGVGKRSMIRILAGLTGNQLNVVGANREMDTVELLGSFEQKSLQREIVELVEESTTCVTAMINSISQKQHASTWTQFFKHIWITLYATSLRNLKLSNTDTMDAYRLQLSQMKDLIEKVQPFSSHNTAKKCEALRARIHRLMRKSLYYSESMYSSGNFEWLDSVLIKSIKRGDWLMIENANLMNPATLDRLNSLVEPNGTLSLNEKGSGADGVEIVRPHPNFRIILTMSPEHGELSRAMRNRGQEIYVATRFYFEDFLMLLNQNGFEPEEKKACMTYCIMQTSYDTHKKVTNEEPEEEGSLLAYFGLNYIPTLTHQVRRGMQIDKILSDLLIAYYLQKGFEFDIEAVGGYIRERLNEYRETYQVNLIDERYKWRHLRHDLVSLTGGDAITAMLDRDNRIFYEDFCLDILFKPDEIIENIDIVNTCLTVKIFLELSTHGDFEYRKGFIRETFNNFPNMMNTVNNHVDLLHSEYIPLINSLLPRSDLTPVSEMHVDSRNSPDIHYYLQSLDYEGTVKRESLQNRWLLSLHRIMLRMIVELVEERTMEVPGNTSLWAISERFKAGAINREDLVRPCAEICSDLYDLLNGMLRVVSNRCFDDPLVIKMLPKLFWISYFLCKLKRGYNNSELIAVCNQIPMLWMLTHQKVIEPMIKECNMADLSYNNKKFSYRVQHINDFLDMTVTKLGQVEKAQYNKIVNMYAATTKLCEVIAREVDKFFANLVGRYTSRSKTVSSNPENLDALIASGLAWSNSTYMDAFYGVEDRLLQVDIADKNLNHLNAPISGAELAAYAEAKAIMKEKKDEYSIHEEWLINDQYRNKCCNVNRRRNALDQFAPVWQLELVQMRLARLSPTESDPTRYLDLLRQILRSVNGIIMSPKFYGVLIKFLRRLEKRKNCLEEPELDTIPKENVEMYTSFLADYLLENVVLDHQVVGWTKLRVTTNNLPSLAPLIPEYSPIISLVGSYCLDISHLKLNSHLSTSVQLDSMIVYLWRNYASIKLGSNKDLQDIALVQNLVHLRQKLDARYQGNQTYKCNGAKDCSCIDEYIKSTTPSYEKLVMTLKTKLDAGAFDDTLKAVKLIYFGQRYSQEYAPIFHLDPSLRTREKLEIYKSELAHVKLDLHFRNTLFYWKTGENLQLNEIDSEEAATYPFSTRVLIDRRVKLEKSISKLRREYINRPRSDDGSLYYELRKDVQVSSSVCTSNIQALMNGLESYVCTKSSGISPKLLNLITKCRMVIRNLERSISRFRSEYALYADLMTDFLVGMCFVHQGLRCLYSRLEQRMQTIEYGFNMPATDYANILYRVISFSKFTQGDLISVRSKLKLYPKLEKICPQEAVSSMQSLLLRTVLIQLKHHIAITPSDFKRCIPIARNIADLFHSAWLKRKLYLEEQRKLKEELYHYKTSRTTLGTEISYEKQEFLDLCSKFPTYDHIFQSHFSIPPTSTDKENLETEEKVINLNRSVDLSVCIEICKAHYNFTKEASRSLLGQVDLDRSSEPLHIDLPTIIKLEAETLYTISRHCLPTLDKSFDSLTVECHLLQACQLNKLLNQTQGISPVLGSLKSSIEILDEKIFDIYHDGNAYEALKFQEYINKLDTKINYLRNLQTRTYDAHPTLLSTIKLMNRISSFLITDPMMKFITGSHTLLEKIEQWNQQSIPKDDKMIKEADELIELIKSWRSTELDSWKSSLHRVKRKYIDGTLCDLWFTLYEAFNNPVVWVRNFLLEEKGFELTSENEDIFYKGFALFIKEFIENSTLGDYQIRLDLVFSFTIQARFASLYEQARPDYTKGVVGTGATKDLTVDFEKLTTYVYNVYIQFRGMLEPLKESLSSEEKRLTKELNTEIRIVAWQGRNLWDIKNNFRLSHRKLNKVMNRYLEVLRRPLSIKPQGDVPPLDNPETPLKDSDQIGLTLMSIQVLIERVKPLSNALIKLKSLHKTPKIVRKLKQLHTTINKQMQVRYVENLSAIEQMIDHNYDAIASFHQHKVQDVIIHEKDTKETKASKLKLCRQMHHSKKFSMQNIFKNLQNLGASYQRGLNSHVILDEHIMSLEPLRGMIQNKSQLVLRAASKLVDDRIIVSCNENYRKLIASNMVLFAFTPECASDLNTNQLDRIKGYSIDMIMDVIRHYKNAALMYKHLMDIQASTKRLTQLQTISESGPVVIYNFNRIHKSVQQFNELVGRAYLAISKLEQMTTCCRQAMDLKAQEDGRTSPLIPNIQKFKGERAILMEVICETPECDSLITKDQLDHIQANIKVSRKSVAEISDNLRDMLNHTSRIHMYSDDDIQRLVQMYEQFYTDFNALIPPASSGQSSSKPETLFGSLKALLDEADRSLKPNIQLGKLRGDAVTISVDSHPNSTRLNLRLRKVIRQAMLAFQEMYKEESSRKDAKSCGESSRRKMKPFNLIDSSSMRNILQLEKMSKYTGDCFMTLNQEDASTDIEPIVKALTPILYIYTQDVASYLNIILSSLQLRMKAAQQLILFFTNLVRDGFGLPVKVADDNGSEKTSGKTSEDNAGFGEGQGDTDVSKKLEFESQLDDLKNDKSEQKDTEDESVKAHDDGVEMSEDIDARAEGADDGSCKSDDQEEEEDVDETPLDELDKEMGSVDQDELKLDEKLWGEKDDHLDEEEDDQQDLRETEASASMPESEQEAELQAKDEQLAQSSVERKPDTNKNCAKPQETQNQVSEAPEDGDDNEPSKLDLEDEAAQALKDQEMPSSNDIQDETNNSNIIDMSVSDDEQAAETEQDKELPGQQDENADGKSEGELSDDANEDDIADDEIKSTKSSQNLIDDDDIDKQLEVAVRHPHLDEKLEDPIEETIRNLSAAAATRENGREPSQQMAGEKIGSHTLYNIYDEDDDDPLEDLEGQDCEDGQEGGDEIARAQSNATNGMNEEANKTQEKSDDINEVNEQEIVSDHSPEVTAQPTKRTHADRNQLDTTSVKRQKILEASEGKGEPASSEDEQTAEDSAKDSGSSFRHIEKDKINAPEVVDLVSSSDEEAGESVLDQVELGTDSKLKPKDSKSPKTTSADPSEDVNMQAVNAEEGQVDAEDVKAAAQLETASLSSISSFESGELTENSNDSEENPNVDRNLDTSYNTNLGLLKYISLNMQESNPDTNLIERIDNELNRKQTNQEHDSVDTDRLTSLWLDCTKRTGHLVHELCQQLQIVLQPTKMSKYKGDYKSGKRLNMRKIISYIASHYRKDKIWLRRTKPSKRTYNISLAVDNSSSMSENNCRHMTYQSLALLAKSLSLIEAGSLNVVSFGKEVKCIHEFGQPYVDAIGAQWLRELRFNESKTSYKSLLEFSSKSFAKQGQAVQSQGNLSQLLIIMSDGRNVSSEEEEVKIHLRTLKSMGVLTLFVIIDDLKRNDGRSIVDVKRCLKLGRNTDLVSYMELFPFPFYVLLRQLDTMPSILGDALRQWFELVSNN